MDDKYGRQDSRDKINISRVTVSGTSPIPVPSASLGRRNYIKIKNVGSVDVSLVTASGSEASDGYIITGNGGEWEDTTDASFYIVSTTGASSDISVYERSSRFNYK